MAQFKKVTKRGTDHFSSTPCLSDAGFDVFVSDVGLFMGRVSQRW